MINGIEECEFGEGARPFNDESDGPRGLNTTVEEISFPDGVARYPVYGRYAVARG